MTKQRLVGVLLAVVVLVPVITSCVRHPPVNTVPAQRIEMTSTNGQAELLLKPASVRGVVIFMHGINSNQNELLDDAGLFPVRDALLRAHFAIASSHAHGDNLGNPVSLVDQVNVLQDATARLSKGLPVYTLAFSMGGVDGLLTAANNSLPGLRAVALLSPVCDQLVYLDGDYRGALENAFDYSSDRALEAAVSASDPVRQPGVNYAGKVYGFWQSPTDQLVPASQSARMVAHLHAAGVQAGLTALSGKHGDLSKLDPADVVAFFDAAQPNES